MTKLLALTLTLAALPLAACGASVEGSTAPPPRPVRTADVRPQEAQGRIRYSVSVQPY